MKYQLVSIQKFSYSVMPDLIRHPEAFEKTGFRLGGGNDEVSHDLISGWTLAEVIQIYTGYIEGSQPGVERGICHNEKDHWACRHL